MKIGRELKTLTSDDIAFILNPATTDEEADRRMITARKRDAIVNSPKGNHFRV